MVYSDIGIGSIQEEVQPIVQRAKGKLAAVGQSVFEVSTILFADLVGSTAAKEKYGHTRGMRRCWAHNFTAGEIIERFDGRVVKFMGDAVLAAFSSNLDAVVSAVVFREALGMLQLPGEEFQVPLQTRVTLTTGAVEVFDTESGYDIGGQVVDKAARLQKYTKPGQILAEAGVVEPIRVILEEKMPFIKIPGSEDIKELRLEGISYPVRVLEIKTID